MPELFIDPEIRARFPELRAAGFLVSDLNKLEWKKIDFASLYEQAKKKHIQAAGLSTENLLQCSTVAEWRKALRDCGIKPSEFRGSVEQLLRHFLRGQTLSTGIPAIDLYCGFSLLYLSSLGGYDFDELGLQMVSLRFAKPGEDRFEPLGAKPEDFPLTKETPVYTAGSEVLCWGFNCRDAQRTSLRDKSKTALFIGEALNARQLHDLEDCLNELRRLLQSLGANPDPIFSK